MILKQHNWQLLVVVDHIQLLTMAPDAVDASDCSLLSPPVTEQYPQAPFNCTVLIGAACPGNRTPNPPHTMEATVWPPRLLLIIINSNNCN